MLNPAVLFILNFQSFSTSLKLFEQENFDINDYLEEFTTAIPEDFTQPEQTTFYNNLATTFETTTAEAIITCNPGFYLQNTTKTCLKNKCSCDNGKPVDFCPENGKQICRNCFLGYNLDNINKVCQENQCLCENGENAMGQNCTRNGLNLCQNCDDFYYLNPKKKCLPNVCNCPNGGKGDLLCEKHGEITCNRCNHGYHLLNQKCFENKCTCLNGVPRTGSKCKTNGIEACDVCNAGFHRNGKKCLENVCKCNFGAEARGEKCTKNKAKICVTCDPGYHLKNGKCEQNVCFCDDGHAETGKNCEFNNSNKCAVCDYGFKKDADKCESINYPLKFTQIPTFSGNPSHAENTIRILDDEASTKCVVKRYNGFKAGQTMWYNKCNSDHKNKNKVAKSKFEFNTENQVISKGAFQLFSKNLCWNIKSLKRFGKQRISLQNCDSGSDLQKFEMMDGRLHVMSEHKICLGVLGNLATLQFCYPNVWGYAGYKFNSTWIAEDGTIRPYGDKNDLCLFKVKNWFKNNDQVWLVKCDRYHKTESRAVRFQWVYNTETKQIKTKGNLDFCMKLPNSKRKQQQKVRMEKCDKNEILQKFDFVNGRIHSAANRILCGSYNLSKVNDRNKAPFIFSKCYVNAVGISDRHLVL